MKIEFDEQSNSMYIRFTNNHVEWTDNYASNVNVDMDKECLIVGIEILDFTNSIFYKQIKDITENKET